VSFVFRAKYTSFELARNREFLYLQGRLGETLRVTQQADGQPVRLLRKSPCLKKTELTSRSPHSTNGV
jgi:hypothetical protein